MHLEFTGEAVTECLGGADSVLEEALSTNYMSLCDPRLNARQSLDLAFHVAELMRGAWLGCQESPARSRCDVAVRRLAILGTGLIGASVALAAKRSGDIHVTGYDPDEEMLATAAERGAVDERAPTLEAALADAELAVVAAPVAQLAAQVAAVLQAAPEACTVTDVGSTKESVCAAASGSPRFIGGHPVCGSEARGADHASAELFEGATWFLTPLPETDPERYRLVHGFVSALGATPVAVDPHAHDRLVALTSHLPHALANLLVNQAGASRVDGHEPLAAAGGSLRDMTRVAGANPRIWVDIFLDNAEELRTALSDHRRRVEQLESALGAATRASWPAGSPRRPATGGACWSGSSRSPASCSAFASTSPTARGCWPASRRHSGPSGSTSRTSSSATSRPSAAAS